jgi:hypothetical protein
MRMLTAKPLSSPPMEGHPHRLPNRRTESNRGAASQAAMADRGRRHLRVRHSGARDAACAWVPLILLGCGAKRLGAPLALEYDCDSALGESGPHGVSCRAWQRPRHRPRSRRADRGSGEAPWCRGVRPLVRGKDQGVINCNRVDAIDGKSRRRVVELRHRSSRHSDR